MQTIRSIGFDRPIIIIHPGEYHSCGSDSIISTLLGSCVAVALCDPVRQVGGMNHFMLPGKIGNADIYQTDSGKYGINAMELLINAILKRGGRKEAFVAKVFGGGAILPVSPMRKTNIAQDNIAFAFRFLETEGIKTLSYDVGGTMARKILLFPDSGRVLVRRVKGSLVQPISSEETGYLARLRKKIGTQGDFISFVDTPP